MLAKYKMSIHHPVCYLRERNHFSLKISMMDQIFLKIFEMNNTFTRNNLLTN